MYFNIAVPRFTSYYTYYSNICNTIISIRTVLYKYCIAYIQRYVVKLNFIGYIEYMRNCNNTYKFFFKLVAFIYFAAFFISFAYQTPPCNFCILEKIITAVIGIVGMLVVLIESYDYWFMKSTQVILIILTTIGLIITSKHTYMILHNTNAINNGYACSLPLGFLWKTRSIINFIITIMSTSPSVQCTKHVISILGIPAPIILLLILLLTLIAAIFIPVKKSNGFTF